MKQLSDTKIRTSEFRVSYPHLFHPYSFNESDTEEYSVVALFPKNTDLKKLKKAIKKVANNKWPGKNSKKIRMPEFKDGDELEDSNGESLKETEDKIVINFRTKLRKPLVLDKHRQPITDEEEIYGGCYGVAVVEPYAWENQFGKGVSIGLQGFQKTRDGERFASSITVDDFEDIDENDNEDDEDEFFF